MSDKIRATHLDRRAVVYLRQSDPKQVREHRESTARQYALRERKVFNRGKGLEVRAPRMPYPEGSAMPICAAPALRARPSAAAGRRPRRA